MNSKVPRYSLALGDRGTIVGRKRGGIMLAIFTALIFQQPSYSCVRLSMNYEHITAGIQIDLWSRRLAVHI